MRLFIVLGAIWSLLLSGVVGVKVLTGSNEITGSVALLAFCFGGLAPFLLNHWRPFFKNWPELRRRLQGQLLAEGVLGENDLERGLHLVEVEEVEPGQDSPRPGSRQLAFLELDGDVLRLLGENYCLSGDDFEIPRINEAHCPDCPLVWACGGEPFRLRIYVGKLTREFKIFCLEGKSLREAMRSSAMLEETLDAVDELPPASAD